MSYLRGIEAIDLWIKKDTPDVPSDGRYHIVSKGTVVASMRGEAKAIAEYRRRVQESGYTPPPPKPRDPNAAIQEGLDRTFMEAEEYWGSSSGFRPKGGKGR